MYSDEFKRKYLHFVENIKIHNAKNFTMKELSVHLEVSERTLIDFFNGKIIRVDILEQVLSINGFSFDINSNVEIVKI